MPETEVKKQYVIHLERYDDEFRPSGELKGSKPALTIPMGYICPITGLLMTEPVTAADGYTYERHAIELILEGCNPISPMTGEPLHDKELTPYIRMQTDIREFYQKTLLPFMEPPKTDYLTHIKFTDLLQSFLTAIENNNFYVSNRILSDESNKNTIVSLLHQLKLIINSDDASNAITEAISLIRDNKSQDFKKIKKLLSSFPKITSTGIPEMKFLTSSVLLDFLNAIINGDIDRTQRMIQEDYYCSTLLNVSGKNLCDIQGVVLDHTGTLYIEITGFHLTILLSHYEMFDVMKTPMGKQKTKEQLQTFKEKIQDHVEHIKWDDLLHKYDKLISCINELRELKKACLSEPEEEIYRKRKKIEFILQEFGALQHNLPKHILYRFFNPQIYYILQSFEISFDCEGMKKFYSLVNLNRLGLDYILLLTETEIIYISLMVKPQTNFKSSMSSIDSCEQMIAYNEKIESRDNCLAKCAVDLERNKELLSCLLQQLPKKIEDAMINIVSEQKALEKNEEHEHPLSWSEWLRSWWTQPQQQEQNGKNEQRPKTISYIAKPG